MYGNACAGTGITIEITGRVEANLLCSFGLTKTFFFIPH